LVEIGGSSGKSSMFSKDGTHRLIFEKSKNHIISRVCFHQFIYLIVGLNPLVETGNGGNVVCR
jgi:hypothetical protein